MTFNSQYGCRVLYCSVNFIWSKSISAFNGWFYFFFYWANSSFRHITVPQILHSLKPLTRWWALLTVEGEVRQSNRQMRFLRIIYQSLMNRKTHCTFTLITFCTMLMFSEHSDRRLVTKHHLVNYFKTFICVELFFSHQVIHFLCRVFIVIH